MNQPVLRAEKPSGTFYVYWSENRRSHRRSLKTKDPALARALFAKWLMLDRNAPPTADMTIGDCWLLYAAKHHPVTAVEMRRTWEWLLAPVFANVKVSAFGQADVDRYVDARVGGVLGRKVQPHSTRKELSAILAAMNFAARAGRFAPGLVARVRLPHPGAPRERWLREEETDALFGAAAADPVLTLFLHLALNTAGRVQAILDLTWDRVDFTTGVIHLDVPGRAKTKKRRASVPISKALRGALIDRAVQHGKPFPGVTAHDIWTRLNKAVVAAGLAVETKTQAGRQRATGISPHVLRHTAATRMVHAGVPLASVAAILGNSVNVVERVYSHHCPEHLRAAVDTISERRKTDHP